jgi:26S proteasome regulatory subunit N5
MIKLDQHESAYFFICRHYSHIYNTPRIKNDSALMKEALKNYVIYLLLSPYGTEQQSMLHKLAEDKNLDQVPKYK